MGLADALTGKRDLAEAIAQDAFVADIDGGIGYRLGIYEAGDWSFVVAGD